MELPENVLSVWNSKASVIPPSILVAVGGSGVLCLLIAAFLTPHLNILLRAWSEARVPAALAGARARGVFVLSLFVCQLLRAAALFGIAGMLRGGHFWLVQALVTFPGAGFLTSFSLVVLFWTNVNNAAKLSSSSFPLACVLVVNATGWTLLGALFAVCYWLGAPREFIGVSNAILGIFLLVTACLLFFYGVEVVRQFPLLGEELSDRDHFKRRSRIVKRVVTLSLLLPALLVVGAVLAAFMSRHSLASGGAWSPRRQFSWLVAFWLVSESAPTVVVLSSLWPRKQGVKAADEVATAVETERSVRLLESYKVEGFVNEDVF